MVIPSVPTQTKSAWPSIWDGLCPHDPVSFHKLFFIPNVLFISEKRESVEDSHLLNLFLINWTDLPAIYRHSMLLSWVSKFLVHLPPDSLGQALTSFILTQL